MGLHGEQLKEMKILYVEDDAVTAEELGYFLKRRAGKVYIAHDGQEGLDLYEEHSPDIIIADLFLPKMGGIAMVKRIREMGHETPVIITTAVNDSNVILSAVDTGIHKYILKPINTSELLDELNVLAEKIAEAAANPESLYFTNKKELEGRIKKEFSSMMKSLTGKGPKDVVVFISKGTVEICCSEAMTVYEKTVLDNFRNIAIIEQNRRLFYQIVEPRISGQIEEILGRSIHLIDVEINLKQDRNILTFRIDV